MTILVDQQTKALCLNTQIDEDVKEALKALVFSDHTPSFVEQFDQISPNEGISQFLFFQASEECNVSYKDRSGKYQGQTTIVTPKV